MTLGGGAGGGGGGTSLGLDLLAVIQAAVVGLVLFSAAVIAVRRAASAPRATSLSTPRPTGCAASYNHHHYSLPRYLMGNPQEQGTTAADLTGPCAACGVVSSKKCSACKRVRYCSQECQTKHWQIDHKFKCKQMKSKDLAADSKLRRYEKKSLPLFKPLDLLYEANLRKLKVLLGQITEGKFCFTSSKPHVAASKDLEAKKDKTMHIGTKKDPGTVPINAGGRSFTSDDEEQHSSLILDDPRTHGWDDESIQTQGMVKHSSHQHVQCDRHKKMSQRFENSGRQGLGTEMQQDHSKTSNLLGQEFSMTRCLALLKDIVDLSDDVKIQASEVFKDALNREIFLGYETRLRALWLTKEVNKLAVLSNAS